MARAWILSALGVGVVVTIVLLAGRKETKGNGTPVPPPPPRRVAPDPLSENEVLTFLHVWPRQTEIIQKHAGAARNDAQANRQIGARIREEVELLLAQRNLTPERWDRIRERVNLVVDILRFEAQTDERVKKIDQEIRQKQSLLEGLSPDSETSRQLRASIERLQTMRDAPPPPLSDSDRKLARRYWDQLDAAVPGTSMSREER